MWLLNLYSRKSLFCPVIGFPCWNPQSIIFKVSISNCESSSSREKRRGTHKCWRHSPLCMPVALVLMVSVNISARQQNHLGDALLSMRVTMIRSMDIVWPMLTIGRIFVWARRVGLKVVCWASEPALYKSGKVSQALAQTHSLLSSYGSQYNRLLQALAAVTPLPWQTGTWDFHLVKVFLLQLFITAQKKKLRHLYASISEHHIHVSVVFFQMSGLLHLILWLRTIDRNQRMTLAMRLL